MIILLQATRTVNSVLNLPHHLRLLCRVQNAPTLPNASTSYKTGAQMTASHHLTPTTLSIYNSHLSLECKHITSTLVANAGLPSRSRCLV